MRNKTAFIVNPDPRSLWKVVEPPAGASYPKSHLDAAGWSGVTYVLLPPVAGDDLMSMPGASEMTTSISTTAEETGWSVMLVADGAGSAVNSRKAPGLQSKRLAITFSISSVV